MTLAKLSSGDRRLSWLGVGNVEGVLFASGGDCEKSQQRALLRSGIVGYRLPVLRTTTLAVEPGDLLTMATDGIDAGFTECLARPGTPQEIADRIVETRFKGTDDALALVALILDRPP
jgi:hypothetical protein